MSEVIKKLAKNLKAIRQANDLTTEELANRSNLSTAYINRLEHEKAQRVSLIVVDQVAHALGVSLFDLTNETKDMPDLDHELSLLREAAIKYGGAETILRVRKALPGLYEGMIGEKQNEYPQSYIDLPQTKKKKAG